jgi:hypothetical protein
MPRAIRQLAAILSGLLVFALLPVEGQASLQLHLKLDDGAPSSTAIDSSGNGNHGTLMDMNPLTDWVAAGVAGGALDFDPTGDSQRISVNDGFDFGSADFSLSFWVNKQSGSNGFGNIAGLAKWHTGGSAGTNEWALSISTGSTGAGDDQPTFYIESGTTSYAATSPDNITLNEWHHIVGVRDGSFIRIYVDNVLKASTNVGSVAINDLPDRALTVANFDSNFRSPNAIFDDIQIYDQALSAADVSFLFDNPGASLAAVVPEASSFVVWSLIGLTVGGSTWWRRRRRGHEPER